MTVKYTKVILELHVKDSTSIAQVLRKLGLKEAGGNHSHISRKIKEYEIDTSHFLGQASNCGLLHLGGLKSKTTEDILVVRESGPRTNVKYLRRAMLASGVEHKCVECGLTDTWNGKPIRLEVDHINENWLDNRLCNLRFVCPNCHSQK